MLYELCNSKKLKINFHNGKKSFYVENDSFHKDKNKDQVTENIKDLFTSDNKTSLPQDSLETPKRITLV